MAKSSPRVAAHDVHNADLATILTIPETTPHIDVTIGNHEVLTILNSPVEEPRPVNLSFIPLEYYRESFAPDPASFPRSIADHQEAKMLSHKTLSPVEEIGCSKRK